MRFVSPLVIEELVLPDGWENEVTVAETAVAAMANEPRAVRNAKIEQFATKTWRALKTLLSALNNGKCWYCDSRQGRSNNNIDHFRPKGAVNDCPDHPGYWWLAFNVINMRFCCTFCNSRRSDGGSGLVGKHDNFPLFGQFRQMNSGDDIQLEDPVLLDPTSDADIGLLTWGIDGASAPRFSQQQHQKWWQRAYVSIRIYDLNHQYLRKFRKRIYSQIKLQIKDGDLYFKRALIGDATAEIALGRVKGVLVALLSESAECSSEARHYFAEFRDRSKRPWLDAIN